MTSSTGEVKDAVRLAQQYNIHIYKYLINGLGNSSLRTSQLKVELEEYTRSSMKFFDRLYQIRDSKIPWVRVREEQINVFREQVKRNEKLVQEVHNIQRRLWNLRAMGQRVPMANKHLILQAFPELCVSTRPDNVPLTVLCDQIIHKYSLRNVRLIMDMLRWANEERMARKKSNQVLSSTGPSNPRLLVTKSEVTENQTAEDNIEMNDVTPVQSWDDISEEIIQPLTPGEMEGHSTTTTINGTNPNTSIDTSQDKPQPVIMSPDMKTSLTINVHDAEMISKPDITPSNPKPIRASEQEPSMLCELMAAIRDIPELEALQATVNKPDLNPSTGHSQGLDTEISAQTNPSVIKKDITISKIKDDPLQYKENVLHDYNPRNRKISSWDELIKRFTKSEEARKVSTVVTQPKPIVKSSLLEVKSSEGSQSSVLRAPTDSLLSSDIKGSTMPDKVSVPIKEVSNCNSTRPQCDTIEKQMSETTDTIEESVTVIKKEIQKTPIKVKPLQPLVGTDRPHVYENIIKKRKQHGPTDKVKTMTSAEVNEYNKKREEALRQLEMKKQRTKNILNEKYDKTFPKKSSVHYFKVQNVHIDVKFSKNTSSVGQSKYPTPTTSVLTNTRKESMSTGNVRDMTSRKRPASVNSVCSMPAPKRPRRPRIILKIFRDDDDWNVEQVIDRD